MTKEKKTEEIPESEKDVGLKKAIFAIFAVVMVITIFSGGEETAPVNKAKTVTLSPSGGSYNADGTPLGGGTNKTVGDYDKYAQCYGVMTELHKANGLHTRNRVMSIDIKETICSGYSRGEYPSYPGK